MLTIWIIMSIKEKKEEANLCWDSWAIPCIQNNFLEHYNFLWFFKILFQILIQIP